MVEVVSFDYSDRLLLRGPHTVYTLALGDECTDGTRNLALVSAPAGCFLRQHGRF